MMFVKQLNLNKSILAHQNLCQMLQNEKQPSIFCLQEPYYSKYGRLTGIPKNYKFFGINMSRSIIISTYIDVINHCEKYEKKIILFNKTIGCSL